MPKEDVIVYTLEEVEKVSKQAAKKMRAAGLTKVLMPVSFFEDEANIDKFEQELKTFDMIDGIEIFKTGTWNGDTYTEVDLDNIIKNFNKMKVKQAVPIKLGHGEAQKMLRDEGLPAAGWVDNLTRQGNRLVASVKDVPKKVAELINKRAYKKVSSEIYPIYKDSDGNVLHKVLRAVALLGGDIPAVEGLADIRALYHQKGEQKFKIYTIREEDKIEFSVMPKIKLKQIIKGGDKVMPKTLGVMVSADKFEEGFQEKLSEALKKTFGDTTSVKFQDEEEEKKLQDEDEKEKTDLKEKVASLTKKLEEDEEEKKKLQDDEEEKKLQAADEDDKEKAELKQQVKTLKKKLAEDEEEKEKMAEEGEEKEKEFSEYREKVRGQEIDALISDGEKAGKILPKHRETIRTMLKNADDSKVLKFKQADGKETEKTQFQVTKGYVQNLPILVNFSEISKDGEAPVGKQKDTFIDGKGETFKVVDADVDAVVEKYAQDNDLSYAEALIEVSKEKKGTS